MTFSDQLRAIGRYWYALVLLLVVGAVVAVAAVGLQTANYQSKFKLALGPAAGVTGSSLSQVQSALNNVSIPATLAQIAGSDNVKNTAATAAGVSTSGLQIAAVVANNSNVVEVSVSSSHKADVSKIASAVSDQGRAQFVKLYPLFSVTAIGTPSTPKDTRASTVVAGVLGAILGLIVGYLIALAIAALTSARTPGRRRDGGRSDISGGDIVGGGHGASVPSDIPAGGRVL